MQPLARPSRVFGLALAAVLLLGAGAAQAQCNANQLCPANANPCIVSSSCTVPAGKLFDLGARALVIKGGKTITIDNGTDPLHIKAGSILFEIGAKIIASGVTGTFGSGGNVILESTSTFTMQSGGGTNSKIDVTGGFSAGSIQIRAAGAIDINALLQANCESPDGFGGQIDIFTDQGTVNVTGAGLQAKGGGRGENGASGGTVSIAAPGNVNVSAPLDVGGGDCVCDISLDSFNGNVTTTSAATMNLQAAGSIGDGGSVTVSAGGDVALGGTISAIAKGSGGLDGLGGGFGGDLDVFALGSVTLSAVTDLAGNSPDGDAGNVDVQADLDITLTGQLLARTMGLGAGGDVFLAAARNVTMGGLISTHADAYGGAVEIDAGQTMTVSGTIEADGLTLGGTIDLQACTLDLTPSGLLDSRGPGTFPQATNAIATSSMAKIRGRMLSGAANRLRWRGTAPVFTPPPLPLPHIAPASQSTNDPSLPCCVGCPVCGDGVTVMPDEQCDDGNTVNGDGCSQFCTIETTTTTTTRPSTSTTRASTTLVPTTTTLVTTTSAVPTTTTTTTSTTTTTTLPIVCGNGIVQAGEQCDDGNTVGGDCCSATCAYEANGATCTSDNNACTVDRCNATGVCTHPAGNPGTVCRPAAAAGCDVAEVCTGSSTTCPADAFAPATTVCRAAAGACDLPENCSGTGSGCPADQKRTDECRAAAGVCDLAEQCDGVGNACPPDVKSTAVCRAAAGSCDVAESCNGTGNTCPADVKANDGTACGAAACTIGGTCQAGQCVGATTLTCPACETCDVVAGGCVAAPRDVCLAPIQARASQLQFKRSSKGPQADAFQWKWLKAPDIATSLFGDPSTTDGVAVCVYDRSQATPTVLFRAVAPAGGLCGEKACWVPTGTKGWKYTSKIPNPNGVIGISLTSGVGGKGKVLVKGKGVHLSDRPAGLPGMPLAAGQVQVQLQSQNGACFGATFDPAAAEKNRAEEFNGKGQ